MAAGAFVFRVRCDDAPVRDLVEHLFADLPDGQGPSSEFSLTTAGRGLLVLDGPPPLPTPTALAADVVVSDLVTAVNRQMLDAGAERLHLHAGAVAREGAAVVVAAPSGHGKTTLVTALARRGWTYLSDEAVSIACGDPSVRAFPKPISLKHTGFDLFPELAAHRVPPGREDATIWQVPLGPTGVAVATAAEPVLVVLLRRDADRERPEWEHLPPAEAVVHLVEQTLDLERYGTRALFALGELCARCRCVLVHAGGPEATARLVEELADQPRPRPVEARRVGIDAAVTFAAPGVEAITIGDEAVLRHPHSGEVISLNPAAAAIWLRVSDGSLDPSVAEPDVEAFVGQLVELGYAIQPQEAPPRVQ
jgi:hypothetical protein